MAIGALAAIAYEQSRRPRYTFEEIREMRSLIRSLHYQGYALPIEQVDRELETYMRHGVRPRALRPAADASARADARAAALDYKMRLRQQEILLGG